MEESVKNCCVFSIECLRAPGTDAGLIRPSRTLAVPGTCHLCEATSRPPMGFGLVPVTMRWWFRKMPISNIYLRIYDNPGVDASATGVRRPAAVLRDGDAWAFWQLPGDTLSPVVSDGRRALHRPCDWLHVGRFYPRPERSAAADRRSVQSTSYGATRAGTAQRNPAAWSRHRSIRAEYCEWRRRPGAVRGSVTPGLSSTGAVAATL
jgi:hypothetical protein